MMNDKKLLIAGFAVSLFIAGFASYYASSSPDGLEKVAEDIGFIETAKENTNADTTLADYGVKGVDNERLSTGTAGVIGVLATAGVSTGLFLVLRRRSGAEK
jgi:cobalt/nickel transport protein